MQSVRDGLRELRFEGDLLATSSSQRPDRERWVEFSLYRTRANQYVLSRVGRSTCFHAPTCSVVARNRIDIRPASELDPNATPCVECSPYFTDDGLVCPEQPRYWAQHSETADGVVKSLYQVGDDGERYMTYVAKRLLETAAVKDSLVKRAFYTEIIQ